MSDPGFPKRALSRCLDAGGVLAADLATRGRDVAVAVNYHATPARQARMLRAHLTFYREHFQCLGEEEMLAFLAGGLRLRRPGLVVSFDDGARDNAEVAAPLLEEAGLRGWFMLPGAFLDRPEAAQPAYFREHVRPGTSDEESLAMTWAQARALARRGHAVACHTWTHRALGPDVSADEVDREVVRARAELEGKLDCRVRAFGWVRGAVGDYSIVADRAVRRTYELAFTSLGCAARTRGDPHAIHRFNVESSFSLPVVRFQISRFNQAAFARRRRAVRAILEGVPGRW